MSETPKPAGDPPTDPPTPTPATPPPAAPSKDDGPPPEPTGKTYTQAEVDALDQKLQRQIAAKARAELLKELDIDDEDVLKGLVEKERARADADKSDAQKAREAADAERAKAEAERETLARERLEIAIERGLRAEGEDPEAEPPLPGSRVKAAMAIALPHALAAEDDDRDAIVAAAVKHTRELAPEIFKAPAGEQDDTTRQTPPPPGRKASERGTGDNGDNSPEARAKAMRDRMKAKRRPPMRKNTPTS